jgi:hypothetical protein
MAYFGGSKAEQAIAHGLLEVTSPEAALTGNDVTFQSMVFSGPLTDLSGWVSFCTSSPQ